MPVRKFSQERPHEKREVTEMCRRRVRLSPPTVSRGIYPTEICRGVCLYKHPSNCTVFTDIRTHLYAPSWVGRLLVNRDVCYPKSRVQQHQWTRNGRSKSGTSYSALLSLNLLSRIEVWLLRPFIYIYIYPYIFKPEKWKKKITAKRTPSFDSQSNMDRIYEGSVALYLDRAIIMENSVSSNSPRCG